MEQQEQALMYFRSHAMEWNQKASMESYSIIENRHLAVLKAMEKYNKHSRLLDIGCGSGQLAILASHIEWDAVGVDFAEEMIELSRNNNRESGANAKFICASIFECDLEPASFDIVSAQGVIEYLPLSELAIFMKIVYNLLKDGGRLLLGSRNRLFNIHSLNNYTEVEIKLGTINKLIEEACILQLAPTQTLAIEKLCTVSGEYEQPNYHPSTGIAVDTRYQFTPADLIYRLGKNGFKASHIYPVNYHAFPLTLTKINEFNRQHTAIAKTMAEKWIDIHNLVPYSSSFVLEAIKS